MLRTVLGDWADTHSLASFEYVALHPFGCRVVQRLLDFCPPMQVQPLLEAALESAPLLVTSVFGNYILQHILLHSPPSARSE